uniref:Uncharacterized protein n=1 Tax=Megaselia scalaris TaxID=36166 RepID=T1GQN9_MEGSC
MREAMISRSLSGGIMKVEFMKSFSPTIIFRFDFLNFLIVFIWSSLMKVVRKLPNHAEYQVVTMNPRTVNNTYIIELLTPCNGFGID